MSHQIGKFRVRSAGKDRGIPPGWLVVLRISFDTETGKHRFLVTDEARAFLTVHQDDVVMDETLLVPEWFK